MHFREVSFSCDFFRVRIMSLHVMEEQSPSSSLCLRFPPVRTARSNYDVCAVGLNRRKGQTWPHLVVVFFHPLGLEIAWHLALQQKCNIKSIRNRNDEQIHHEEDNNGRVVSLLRACQKKWMTVLKLSSSSGHCKY